MHHAGQAYSTLIPCVLHFDPLLLPCVLYSDAASASALNVNLVCLTCCEWLLRADIGCPMCSSYCGDLAKKWIGLPQEADSVMADIRLQLARYAQGIHWVQKNFLLDESISAVLITAGPMPLRMSQQATAASSRQSSHVVLQMQPDFNTPFPAPESWNQQVTHGGLASHSTLTALQCSVWVKAMPWLLLHHSTRTAAQSASLPLAEECSALTMHAAANHREALAGFDTVAHAAKQATVPSSIGH